MPLQLPECCPLEQLSQSKHARYLHDNDFSWRIVYDNIQQILLEHSSRASLSDFQSLLGTEWLEDSVIAALIDCMKRGIPEPDSTAAITMEPPSALRGIDTGKHDRCIDLDEVCILDPAMSRKILSAFQTGDYGDVLRVFSKQCKFKTVRRILLPLNISWEGITLGTGCHWMLAELDLFTGTTHLYDWIEMTHDHYLIVAGVATCNTAIMCIAAHVGLCHTVTHSRSELPTAPLQALLVVLHKRCVGLCLSHAIDDTKRTPPSIHNANAQQNGFDCGVWTCYAMYHRALQRSTVQDPADIFKDMNMKTPQDAKLFRSCQHMGCSLLLSRLPCHCGPMAHLSGRLCPMMSILVPGEQMPFADLDSLVFSPPCSNAGCGCSSACQLIHTTTPTSWSAVTEAHVNLRTKFTVSRSLWSPRTTPPRHGTLRCSVTNQHSSKFRISPPSA